MRKREGLKTNEKMYLQVIYHQGRLMLNLIALYEKFYDTFRNICECDDSGNQLPRVFPPSSQ
jgi:hypothetical protein